MGSRGMTGQGPEDGLDKRLVFKVFSLIFLLVFKSEKPVAVGEEEMEEEGGGTSTEVECGDVIRWWLLRPNSPPDDVAAARLLDPSDNRKRREAEVLAWP